MKFLHISDLHLGKSYKYYDLTNIQQEMLDFLVNYVQQNAIDTLLIAGDVFDKSQPSLSAITLFDDFLAKLYALKKIVLIISGNHDSAERLSLNNRLLTLANVHIASTYAGKLECVHLNDDYGALDVYMLPFIKPATVREYFKDDTVEDYTKAVALALKEVPTDATRKILMAHQFVAGAQQSEGEETPVSVGGIDNVAPFVFEGFDYVALGHIHRAQHVGKENIRYAGTMLRYDIKETNQQKSFTVVELKEKGNLQIQLVNYTPSSTIRVLKGSFYNLIQDEFLATLNLNDYFYIELTDEDDIPNVFQKLKDKFPRCLGMRYVRPSIAQDLETLNFDEVKKIQPFDFFLKLYTTQNDNQALSPYQEENLKQYIQTLWEENNETSNA